MKKDRLCYRSSGRGMRMTANRWWRRKNELVNLCRRGRVVVAAAAAVAAAVTAAADGGEGTTTSNTVREHLWITVVESLTSYHHRTTAEPRGEKVEPNGNERATERTKRKRNFRTRKFRIKRKKNTWQLLNNAKIVGDNRD